MSAIAQHLWIHFHRDSIEEAAKIQKAPFSVRLWDGSVVPLGPGANPEFCVSISDPGVIGGLLRRPTVENLVRHYARGQIDLLRFAGAERQTVLSSGSQEPARQQADWRSQ